MSAAEHAYKFRTRFRHQWRAYQMHACKSEECCRRTGHTQKPRRMASVTSRRKASDEDSVHWTRPPSGTFGKSYPSRVPNN
ncbi:hypothetical protein J6590_023008 [Homalodisca vitripennis]|nr:hypothetical protein J6590_023008 [Homalodisca vitripennis]